MKLSLVSPTTLDSPEWGNRCVSCISVFGVGRRDLLRIWTLVSPGSHSLLHWAASSAFSLPGLCLKLWEIPDMWQELKEVLEVVNIASATISLVMLRGPPGHYWGCSVNQAYSSLLKFEEKVEQTPPGPLPATVIPHYPQSLGLSPIVFGRQHGSRDQRGSDADKVSGLTSVPNYSLSFLIPFNLFSSKSSSERVHGWFDAGLVFRASIF